jgi:hypothetical protein
VSLSAILAATTSSTTDTSSTTISKMFAKSSSYCVGNAGTCVTTNTEEKTAINLGIKAQFCALTGIRFGWSDEGNGTNKVVLFKDAGDNWFANTTGKHERLEAFSVSCIK